MGYKQPDGDMGNARHALSAFGLAAMGCGGCGGTAVEMDATVTDGSVDAVLDAASDARIDAVDETSDVGDVAVCCDPTLAEVPCFVDGSPTLSAHCKPGQHCAICKGAPGYGCCP